MKNYYIHTLVFMSIHGNISCQDQKPTINITVHAPTSTNMLQDNKLDQHAEQSSSLSNKLKNNMHQANNDHDLLPEKKLTPTESVESFAIRSAGKILIISAASFYSLPFAVVYGANRFIIQPLLNNGAFIEEASEEEEKIYAEKGLRKTPDVIAFPIWNRIKKSLTKK